MNRNTLNKILKSMLSLTLVSVLAAGCGTKDPASDSENNTNTAENGNTAQENTGNEAANELQDSDAIIIDSSGEVHVVTEEELEQIDSQAQEAETQPSEQAQEASGSDAGAAESGNGQAAGSENGGSDAGNTGSGEGTGEGGSQIPDEEAEGAGSF